MAPKTEKRATQIRQFAFRISLEKDESMFTDICLKAMKAWVKQEFKKWIMQIENSKLESDDSHNIHLQGYGRTDDKKRPQQILNRMIETFPGKSCYCAPSSEAGVDSLKKYCMKWDTRVAGPWADTKLYLGEDLISEGQMVGFQRWIYKLLPTKPSRRLSYWFYCPKGGSGKSAVAKFLAYFHDVPTYTFAKAWDLLKLVAMEPNKQMYILNLSKTKPAEISGDDLYNVIESIKDGNFCSYKGTDVQRVLMNPPHVVVLANSAPKKDQLTQKRLKVFLIQPLPAHLLEDNHEEPDIMEGMEVFEQQHLVTGDNTQITGLL